MGFFFFSVFHLYVHSHVHIYTMHSVHTETKRREIKNTFKERVKFPILECTVVSRETKHSRILVELPGWLSLLSYAESVLSKWCHCGLRSVSLVQGKPMKSFFLPFPFFPLHENNLKTSKWNQKILVQRVRLRHEWYCLIISEEGAVRLPLLSCLKEEDTHGQTC